MSYLELAILYAVSVISVLAIRYLLNLSLDEDFKDEDNGWP